VYVLMSLWWVDGYRMIHVVTERGCCDKTTGGLRVMDGWLKDVVISVFPLNYLSSVLW